MKFYQNYLLRFSITAMLGLFSFKSVWSQGKYAPNLKRLIEKTFTDEQHINGLKGYEYREGTLITDVDDPEPQVLTVLLKGNKGVVVYSVMEDTIEKLHHIVDIIELKNIPVGWEIRTVGCQEGETEGEIIVALVNPGKGEYVKAIKQAWRCDRDKIRFEAISVKDIKCINEGED